MGWINPDPKTGLPTICQNQGSGLGGYTVNHQTADVSVITLCTQELNDMISNGANLTVQANTVFAEEQEALEEIVDNSITLLLVHELSHTKALFGSSKFGT